MGGADGIANRVEVGPGNGPRDRLSEREVPGHRNLRQGRRVLDTVRRTKIAKGGLWQVQAAAEITCVTHPNLVYSTGANAPSIAGVGVVLAPGVLRDRPWQVAAGLYDGTSACLEVAESELVIVTERMIAFCEVLVVVIWIGDLSLVDVTGGVRGKDVFVEDVARRGIEAVRRNESTGKGDICQRVFGRRFRLREIARSLQRGRHHSAVQELACNLTQAGVTAEDKCLVLPNGTADASSKLIAAVGRLGQRRTP